MNRIPKDVTDAELEVLQALWGQGRPTTVRQLVELLYPDRGMQASSALKAEYASVLKLLERLEAKEYVRRNRDQPVQVFEASVDREGLLGRWLDAVAETLYGGSLTPLLANLISSQRLTSEDRASLRALLGELAAKIGEKPHRH
jgi:BlaI family transcriptional regulator, penicillinase repressor